MWYIRGIMRTSWTKKKSDEEVMELAAYKRSLLKTIRKRQLQFFWHMNRADGLERFVVPTAEVDNAQNTQTVLITLISNKKRIPQ